jgi:hypothetical protein
MRAAMLAAPAMIILAGPGRAASDPCAKFEEPLAYNACLAEQGPHAGTIRGTQRTERGHAAPATRGPHGRMRMEFTVTPR